MFLEELDIQQGTRVPVARRPGLLMVSRWRLLKIFHTLVPPSAALGVDSSNVLPLQRMTGVIEIREFLEIPLCYK